MCSLLDSGMIFNKIFSAVLARINAPASVISLRLPWLSGGSCVRALLRLLLPEGLAVGALSRIFPFLKRAYKEVQCLSARSHSPAWPRRCDFLSRPSSSHQECMKISNNF